MKQKLPDFLCIGAQKAGTTWLHHMLSEHPGLFLPRDKELHFFDNKKNYEKRGLNWYLTNFESATAGQVIGEITPGYLWVSQVPFFGKQKRSESSRFRDKAPSRACELLGAQLKLLVLLRDPVERAVSAYFHHMRKFRVKPDEGILKAGMMHGIIEMGFYFRHLRKWFDTFSRENIWVGFYEEVLYDPANWLSQIFSFLGVDHGYLVGQPQKQYNRNFRYERCNGDVILTEASGVIDCPTKAISAGELEILRTIYREDVSCLKDLLGRDTPWPNFTVT